jgi:hypothetical protein
MPIILAVKHCQGLSDIEIEESKGRKCPGLVIKTVHKHRQPQHNRPTRNQIGVLGIIWSGKTYPQSRASRISIIISRFVVLRKDRLESSTRSWLYRGTGNSHLQGMSLKRAKVVRHSQIMRFVGRRMQAKAASRRHWRKLSQFPVSLAP